MTITIPTYLLWGIIGLVIFGVGFIAGIMCAAYIDREEFPPEDWR